MYQQGIGNGNIYCHCQPENLNKRNFLGFVAERGARNQCTGPAAQQAECVQFVFWDTVLVFVFTSDFARGLHRRLLVLLIEDEGGDTDKDVNENSLLESTATTVRKTTAMTLLIRSACISILSLL